MIFVITAIFVALIITDGLIKLCKKLNIIPNTGKRRVLVVLIPVAIFGGGICLLFGHKYYIIQSAMSEMQYKQGVVEHEDYSYLAEVYDESGVGFMNEYGEMVIPCQFEDMESHAMFSTGLLITAYNAIWTGEESEVDCNYLVDGRGNLISSSYNNYTLYPTDDLIVVRKHKKKYGAINPSGELVIPLEYDSEEELVEAEGLHSLPLDNDEDTVVTTTDADGIETVKILTEEKKHYIINQTTTDADGRTIHLSGLTDLDGNYLIEMAPQILDGKSENGWIYVAPIGEEERYFLNDSLQEVLRGNWGRANATGFMKN